MTHQNTDIKATELADLRFTMPALFIGHGSPINAIEDNEFSHLWSHTSQASPALLQAWHSSK